MDELYAYGLSVYGRPYVWGGEGPLSFDCSGLIRYMLKPIHLVPAADQTAHDLYEWFITRGSREKSGRGALAFFGTGSITHVGWCIDDFIMLHAGGGGRHVTNAAQANVMGASVKIEPIGRRADLIECVMPPYEKVIRL